MAAKSKIQQLAEYTALQSGLPSYWPNAVFPLSGTQYTTPEVVGYATALIAATNLVTSKQADLESARTALTSLVTATGPIVEGAREVIALQFKNAPATLTALGVTPRKKPAPLSSEALAAKAAKIRATREARGTTSKKQKALITGGVTGVTITPVIPPSPAPTASASGSTTSAANGSSPPVVANAVVPGATRS
jgi:hypothetical protein